MAIGTTGQWLHLRLFLEGIETPVISANVQSNINGPAAASIQIVPHDSAMQFRPRTMVHLFYWDYTADLPDVNTDQGPVPRFGGYRLLFSGEVIGIEYTKNPLQRSMVLQCADFSTYWDTTYQTFISYGPHGNFFNESSAVWAGGNALFDDLTSSHVSVLNDYLKRSPKSDGLQGIKGLMGGIISLLEAMGGVPNHTRGVNDFYTIAELKNKMLQQIVAEQDDDTAQRLFDEKAFIAWLDRSMGGLGELVTFRDMMKLLFKWIYYEVVPISAPKFVPGEAATETLKVNKATELSSKARETLASIRDQVTQIGALNTNRGSATIEGVTGPLSAAIDSKLAGQKATASSLAQQLGALADAGVPASAAKALQAAVLQLQSIVDIDPKLQSLGAFTDQGKVWARAATYITQAMRSGGGVFTTKTRTPSKLPRMNMQVFRPDCFFASPPRCNVVFPEHETSFTFRRQFLQEITRLRLGTSGFLTGGGLFGNFYYAPVTDEIKRVAKEQDNAGIRGLLPWEIYSGILPKFEQMSEANYVANKAQRLLSKNIRGKGYSFGQRAANFNYFKYRFAARSIELSMRFNPYMVLGFPALIIDRPWIVDLDTAAIAAKSGSGVADPVFGADILGNLKTMVALLNPPLQFLGMVAGLSHNIDQSGGSTSATLTHARTHRITDDDFLQLYVKEVQKKTTSQVVKTVIKAEEVLRRGDLRLFKFLSDATPQSPPSTAATQQPNKDQLADNSMPLTMAARPTGIPGGGAVVGVAGGFVNLSAASDSFRGSVSEADAKDGRGKVQEPSPYGKLKPGSKGPRGGTVVQVQVTDSQIRKVDEQSFDDKFLPDSQKQKSIKKVIGAPGTVFIWSEVAIVEEVKQRFLESEVPAEEAIRPPWFSPLYSSFFIGDRIYQPFFGTGAVVDEGFFITPSGSLLADQGRTRSQLFDQLKGADGDAVKIAQIFDAAKKAKTISEIPSVEMATDILAYLYGEVKRQNLDVHRFVSDYTSRPIATLEEVLGSHDLELVEDESGKKLKRVTGTVGFHSTAVAPFENLLGLLDDPDTELPRLKEKGKKAPISKKLDPRPGRRERVEAYIRLIQASTGSLGVGLGG